jgi:hypothetical protein
MFNERQQKTLRAALDCLIPPDDFPGAWDAGVGDYLDGLLRGDEAQLQPVYRLGLDALEAEAQAQYGTGFAELKAARQETLLKAVEEGEVDALWPIPARQFFALLNRHAAEGFYSDPGNGGNREAVSWQMIGFGVREGARA